MTNPFDDWKEEVLGTLNHYPECKFQGMPMDVCDCMERHAFTAGMNVVIERVREVFGLKTPRQEMLDKLSDENWEEPN